MPVQRSRWVALGATAMVGALGCAQDRDELDTTETSSELTWNATVERQKDRLFVQGRAIFRDETFGSEQFFGDALRLHEAIAGAANGGVGPGLSPRAAMELGLEVMSTRLSPEIRTAIREGTIDLDDPAVTLALLQANAIVGVRGFFEGGQLTSVGITCALCHATVDDDFAPGIGLPRDGWPNRDLDVGTIVSLAPNLTPFQDLLGVDRATVVAVLESWGPGRYDARLNFDGKAFRPDGKSGSVLIPAAYGLAGQNLATYTGDGSVPYWNAYVANTQMHGLGTFVDRRRSNLQQFPLVAQTGFDDKRDPVDRITDKLEALHFYQLSIPAPAPIPGTYDSEAAARGQALFNGKAQCSSCHVPPLFSEPGYPMHTGPEIGIDNFQSSRSPTRMYRTTPLRGMRGRLKGGFYHDARFATLADVVDHYNTLFALGLSDTERADLAEYVKSL